MFCHQHLKFDGLQPHYQGLSSPCPLGRERRDPGNELGQPVTQTELFYTFRGDVSLISSRAGGNKPALKPLKARDRTQGSGGNRA